MSATIYFVKCPKCSAKANAKMSAIGSAGTYREAKQKMGVQQISCTFCGFSKTIPDAQSSVFELWFVSEFRGERMWAVNREHLTALISWLSGDRSKRNLKWWIRAEVEVYPKWMILAKNRAGVLKCLRKLLEDDTQEKIS